MVTPPADPQAESPSLPFTFVHGATIRGAASDAQLIRSQLMRQRYWEKRRRTHLEQMRRIDSNLQKRPSVSAPTICRCAAQSRRNLPGPGPAAVDRPIHPKAALPDNDLLAAICANCYGVQANKVSALGSALLPQQIAAAQVDPFRPQSGRISRHFDLLLHHCIHVIWPMTRPHEFAEGVLHAYLHPNRSPMVIQSMLYSASLHRDAMAVIRGSSNHVPQTTEQLRLKGFVMNQILQTLSGADSARDSDVWVDDVLMGILYLAGNENLDKIRPPEKGVFSPPFRTLQAMEFYGSCGYHELHWQIVERILRDRGGLHTVKLYGLAWLISISGLIIAMNTESKPPFPLILPDNKPYIHRAPLQALKIPDSPRHSTTHNRGFHQLALLHPPVKGNIIRVFLDLCEIAQALEVLADQICGPRVLTLIGDTRASVLHRLCSLPGPSDLPSTILHRRHCTTDEQERSIAVYLLCRKTALLYGTNVVLPLPQPGLLRRKWTAEVQEALAQLKWNPHTQPVTEILLWCCMIAGICAAGSDLRPWFVEEARNLCRLVEITSWEGLIELLRSVAWLDRAADESARTFWNEMGIGRV